MSSLVLVAVIVGCECKVAVPGSSGFTERSSDSARFDEDAPEDADERARFRLFVPLPSFDDGDSFGVTAGESAGEGKTFMTAKRKRFSERR